MERRYRLQAQGFDLAKVVERVAKILEMKPEEILSPGKQPRRVMVRRRICYWGVKELGMKGTAVGKLLGVVQSSVSRAAMSLT
jgi:chromosomal replication initiation ATPase DnaA